MAQKDDSRPIAAATQPTRTNWAGNYTYTAAHYAEPASMAALGEVLRSSEHVKAVGSRHSFNHIADTAGTQIGPAGPKTRRLNEAATTVTVDAGTTYGELAPWLHARGFALHNLASLPHISVVGACATATHGSGLANGCLSTAVVSLQLLTPGGEIVELSEATDAELFRLAAVHLGALGIVTEVTLRVQPTFDVAQTVYENLSFDVLRGDLQEVFGAAYSVSLFTDWQGHRATQVWLKRKLANPTDAAFADTFFGATRQTAKLHPLPNMSAENCTEQLGQPGPRYARLPHFRLDYTPSAGAELQTEYFVPIEQACAAIAAVEPLRDRITPLLLVSELRTIAADNLPMSMAYRRPSLALHFTWKQQTAAVLELLPAIEAALEPFHARPHWAKLFTMSPARVRSLYPRFNDFAQLMARFDPAGKFRNAFLAELTGR